MTTTALVHADYRTGSLRRARSVREEDRFVALLSPGAEVHFGALAYHFNHLAAPFGHADVLCVDDYVLSDLGVHHALLESFGCLKTGAL